MEGLPGSGRRYNLRQRSEVGLIGRLPVKARMRPAGIIEAEIAANRSPRLGHRVVGLEIHLLILDGSPQPFDEHVVAPCAPAVHADGDGIVGQQAGERRAGELAALSSRPRLNRWRAVARC